MSAKTQQGILKILRVVRNGPVMAIHAQALYTGQRITKEMFKGKEGKLLLLTTTHKMALPFLS